MEKTKKEAQFTRGKKKIYLAAIIFFITLLILLFSIFISNGAITKVVDLISNHKAEKPIEAVTVALQDADNNGITSGKLKTTPDNEQARLDILAEESRVYCIISSSPSFDTVTDKGSLFISNPEESNYYTQVVLEVAETGKEMYVSPLLSPNEKIEYDYLTCQDFNPGSYPVNALFHYYSKIQDTGDLDRDYSYLGTMCAEVTVNIAKEHSRKFPCTHLCG